MKQLPGVADLPADLRQLLSRHDLLSSLIRRMAVAQAVAEITIEQEASDACLQQFCERRGIDSDDKLMGHCMTHGISLDDLRWQLELPIRIQLYCAEHFQHQAERRFLERKTQLDRVVYSLVRLKDPYLARELYLRIAGQEANFADLASQYTEGPEKETNGIVGPVPLTQAHPVLAEKLRVSAPGQLLEPFRVQEWWLIVRLESYTPASFTDAVAQQMSAELFNQWIDQEAARMLNSLSNPASIAATEH